MANAVGVLEEADEAISSTGLEIDGKTVTAPGRLARQPGKGCGRPTGVAVQLGIKWWQIVSQRQHGETMGKVVVVGDLEYNSAGRQGPVEDEPVVLHGDLDHGW